MCVYIYMYITYVVFILYVIFCYISSQAAAWKQFPTSWFWACPTNSWGLHGSIFWDCGLLNFLLRSNNDDIPSRKLTYPTWGKGKSSSKVPLRGDMLIPWRVFPRWWHKNSTGRSFHDIPSFHFFPRLCHHLSLALDSTHIGAGEKG